MYTTCMKIITYSLVIVFIGFVIFTLTSNKKVDPVVEITEERALCYAWNTEVGDTATLKMVFSGEGGSQVSGFLDYRPFQKDSKKGAFSGTASVLDRERMSRTASLLWSAEGEGLINQEELNIVFGDGSASVLFGEMVDRGDGVYVYKNPESLTPGIQLSQTDCQNIQ